jgi:hypothetical protein
MWTAGIRIKRLAEPALLVFLVTSVFDGLERPMNLFAGINEREGGSRDFFPGRYKNYEGKHLELWKSRDLTALALL